MAVMLRKQYKRIPKNVIVFFSKVLETDSDGYEGKTFLLLKHDTKKVLKEALYTYNNGIFTKIEMVLPRCREDYPTFVGQHSLMFFASAPVYEEASAYSEPNYEGVKRTLKKQYKKLPVNVMVFGEDGVLETNGFEGKTFLLVMHDIKRVLDEALYTYKKGVFTKIETTLLDNQIDYSTYVGSHCFMNS